MKLRCAIIATFIFVISFTVKAQNINDFGLPVYTGVDGFGFNTKGGEGGKVVKVTNLNKPGEGSLANAIEKSGPRIVVFEVAGVINLEESVLKDLQIPFKSKILALPFSNIFDSVRNIVG